jgi:hypothetical protein
LNYRTLGNPGCCGEQWETPFFEFALDVFASWGSGVLDCLFPGLGGFGNIVQLFNGHFLAVVFNTHREFVRIRAYLGHGIFHHFRRPIAQLDAFFPDLPSGVSSRLGRQQQHRHSASQAADQYAGQ